MTPPTDPHWTVEQNRGHPILRWSGDLFLDVGGLYPNAYAALVRAVEDAAQLPATLAERDAALMEVQAHQVGDGYQTGHEHGSAVAVKYRAERDALAATLATVEAERDRFKEHSIRLDNLGWRLAEALGDVSSDAEAVEADINELVSRVVAQRDALAATLATTEAGRDANVAAVIRAGEQIEALEADHRGALDMIAALVAERDDLAAIVARYRSGNATWEPGR